MFDVKKCGKTNYGFWAYGTLKYNGFEIQDIFTVNKELKDGERYKPLLVTLKRNQKHQLRFKLDF